MAHVNIEIKARSNSNDRIRKYLKLHNAEYKGSDHQIDTYYNVPSGRLKLRKGNVENNLIYYSREDKAGPKQSSVSFAHVPEDSEIDSVLKSALGVKVIVDKTREIYFIDNVKFHLDTVVGLGSFMEIEAIDYSGTIGVDELNRQCTFYMSELGIGKDQLLTSSYSDMLDSHL